MAKVNWTEAALADLQEITAYIAKDSYVYAERIADRILKAPRILKKFPNSGRRVPEFSDDSIRELIYRSYRIVYQLKKIRALLWR